VVGRVRVTGRARGRWEDRAGFESEETRTFKKVGSRTDSAARVGFRDGRGKDVSRRAGNFEL
jgi:hypothetical protein